MAEEKHDLHGYLTLLLVALHAKAKGRLSATTAEIIRRTMQAIHSANRLAAGKIKHSDLLDAGAEDSAKERRQRRKAQGLCIDCGREADAGYATCSACREKRRRHYRAWLKRKTPAAP